MSAEILEKIWEEFGEMGHSPKWRLTSKSILGEAIDYYKCSPEAYNTFRNLLLDMMAEERAKAEDQ